MVAFKRLTCLFSLHLLHDMSGLKHHSDVIHRIFCLLCHFILYAYLFFYSFLILSDSFNFYHCDMTSVSCLSSLSHLSPSFSYSLFISLLLTLFLLFFLSFFLPSFFPFFHFYRALRQLHQ